jgi:SAM-dependent methyltransferase
VSFDVPADSYARFMGRYSEPLADLFVDLVAVRRGDHVVDVGCGPGALTARLVARCGAAAVCAVDPSAPFVAAIGERLPGIDVRQAPAEALPFDDDTFDQAVAQLVVHFMADPVAGLREMGRVTRPGGLVAASVWDHHGGRGPLSPFWTAVRELDPSSRGEDTGAGSREGHLAELAGSAGLTGIEATSLTVRLGFGSFDVWWAPYLDGVGPAGSYVASLDDERRRALEQRCRAQLPDPPFEQEAKAWVVLAHAR